MGSLIQREKEAAMLINGKCNKRSISKETSKKASIVTRIYPKGNKYGSALFRRLAGGVGGRGSGARGVACAIFLTVSFTPFYLYPTLFFF